MNSGSPHTPREESEARITAMLLGELPPEDVAALRQTIAQDAELAALHDRLKQAIELVRETVASPEQALLASADAPKLPADRREKLLESFKIIRPKKLAWHRTVNWREWAALAAMVVGLLAVAGTLMIYSGRKDFENVFAGESPSETLLAWFTRGPKSPQKLTPLAGRGVAASDAEPPVEYEAAAGSKSALALLSKDPAPGAERTPPISGSGAVVPGGTPPSDTAAIAGELVKRRSGISTVHAGNTWDEQKPQVPPPPPTRNWHVALGDDFSVQKEFKEQAEVDSKMGKSLKQSIDSGAHRSSRIALPEVAQLDGASISREQEFESRQSLGRGFFFDTPAQHADPADKQGVSKKNP